MIFTFTWNMTTEGQPSQTDMIRDGAQAIRDRFQGVRERLAREHDMNLSTTGEQGVHLAGSGKVYVAAGAPAGVLRPNGDALTAADVGRLYVNSTTQEIYYYNGTTWTKSGDMASMVSIADAGGLITATDVEGALQEIVNRIAVLENKLGASITKIEVV